MFGTRAALARVLAAAAGAAILAHWLLLALARPAALPDDVGFAATWVNVVFAVSFVAVGAIVATHHPDNAVAWTFLAVGTIFALDTLATSVAAWSLIAGEGPSWPGRVGAWFHHWAWFPAIALTGTVALLLFPDGRPPGRRWRFLVPVSLAAIVVGSAGIASERQPTESFDVPNPFALPDRWHLVSEVLAGAGVLLTVACLVPCAAAIVIRFRRAAGAERQQLKLLALAAAFVGITFPLAFLLWDFAPWIVNVQAVALATLPLAAGVAMLRYRLWDIDLLINRALVYGSLAVAIGVVYAAVIGAFAATVSSVSGLWPSLIAAGVVVAIVQPTRSWLQGRANRLLYGERDDPYDTLSRLGRRLQETPTPEEALPAIVDAVARALRSPAVAIELEHDGEFVSAVSIGVEPDGEPVVFPLVHQGETVGRLVLSPRAPGERFDSRDQRLLADLAGQAGAAVHAVRLTAELRRSRERTVAAREEERRRLRRDLHDGLGPALAAFVLELDSARALVESDPRAADALLRRLRDDARDAIAEIRRIAYALRPPALDELGLAASIRQHADVLGATVDVPDMLPPLPAAVEVAALRIAVEGMTNAARHAQAGRCAVRLRIGDGLEIEVEDDGMGLPPEAPVGVGLTSMRERVAELGGTLGIESNGDGTVIRARLPLTT